MRPVAAHVEPATTSFRVERVTEAISALEIHGDCDLATAPELLEAARRLIEQGSHLIVDVSGVTFIDAAAIHALVDAGTAARGRGRALVVQVGAGTFVERVLEITGVDNGFPKALRRAEAVELIDRADAA